MSTTRRNHFTIVCFCIFVSVFCEANELITKDVDLFYDEIKSLGNEYFRSPNKAKFIPLVESLLNRIKEFATHHGDSKDDKKFLLFLYTAALSQLYPMKGYYTIVACNISDNMKFYQDKICDAYTDSVKYLLDLHHDDKYIRNLDAKIKHVIDFIKIDTKPKIKNVLIEIENKIVKLTGEKNYDELKNLDEELKNQDEKNDKELKNQLLRLQMIKLMSTTTSVLEALGHISRSMNPLLEGNPMLTLIAEPFLDGLNDDFNAELLSFESILKYSLVRLRENLNHWKTLFLEQLNDIETKITRYLKNDSSKELSAVGQKILLIKNELKECNVTIEYDLIQAKRRELKDFIEKKRSILKEKHHEECLNQSEGICVLEHAKMLCDLSEITANVYEKLRVDEQKLVTIYKATKSIESELKEWKETERRVCDLMMQRFREIENTRAEFFDGVYNSRHVELNISEWCIQYLIGELKSILHRSMNALYRNFNQNQNAFVENENMNAIPVNLELQKCYDRLNVGMSTLTDVYNRIDTLIEYTRLLIYFSISRKNMAFDSENPQITSLMEIIRTNVALQRYESALFVYNQHQFPFSHVHMPKSKLPLDFQLNDTFTFVKHAFEHIDYLGDKLHNENISELHKNVDFGGSSLWWDNTSTVDPFYTWKSDEIKTEIEDLLQGKEIIVTPNMKKVKLNAVKFDRIGIRLKLEDPDDQSKMDDELVLYQLQMTIEGNCYFKCGQNFFIIPFGHPTIRYSTNRKGESPYFDLVYDDIIKADMFLSPYATWKIKLESDWKGVKDKIKYEPLKMFRNKTIDLELIGRGQYFDDGASFTTQICSEQLVKYYHIDKDLSGTLFDGGN